MVSDHLVTKTYKQLTDTIRNKFFPRRLIHDKNRIDGLRTSIFDTFDQLNKISYKPRFIELPVSGLTIDTSNISIPGIKIKTVLDVIPLSNTGTMQNLYSRMMFGQPIFFNLIRNQDNFVDFVFSQEIYRQIEEKYANKTHDFEFIGNKIILGDKWKGISASGVVVFIPYFNDQPGVDPIPITAESLGNFNGVSTQYFLKLKNYFISPGTVSINASIIDDGESNLNGTGVTGTVNYNNGEIILNYTTAPAVGPITSDYQQLDYQWEFSGKELSFFKEFSERLIQYREGRAQSELKIAGDLTGNSDDLLAADSKLEEIVKKYKDTSFMRLGRRF